MRSAIRNAIRPASRRGRPALSQPAASPSAVSAFADVDDVAIARLSGLVDLQLEQRVEQRAPVVVRDRRMREHMGEVGELQSRFEQRRVGELQLVSGRDQLGRRPAA